MGRKKRSPPPAFATKKRTWERNHYIMLFDDQLNSPAYINLSAPAAATIDASITVSISFKVNEKGNVSGVTISPASAFKEIVKQEITAQLLDWIFEPADYSATATFEYKIVKK